MGRRKGRLAGHQVSGDVPRVVQPGFTRIDVIGEYRLLSYDDGTVRFEHTCDRGPRGVIVCAPALQIGNGHTLTRNNDGQPTVRASILCDDCGTHGWVTDGRWDGA